MITKAAVGVVCTRHWHIALMLIAFFHSMFAGAETALTGGPEIPLKIVFDGDRYLAVSGSKNEAFAPLNLIEVVADGEGRTIHKLPYSNLWPRLLQPLVPEKNASGNEYDAYPPAWAVRGGLFVGVFASDYIYSDRRGFGIFQFPIARAAEVSSTLTGKPVDDLKAIRMASMSKDYAGELPIQITEPSEKYPACFDLAWPDNDELLLFRWEEKGLTVWDKRQGKWAIRASGTAPIGCGFLVTVAGPKIFLVTANGQVFGVTLEGNGARLSNIDGESTKSARLILEDRVQKAVFIYGDSGWFEIAPENGRGRRPLHLDRLDEFVGIKP